jgi:hypothetical protein
MDDLKRMLTGAFDELACDAVHPSDEEIAAALDGAGTAFASAGIRAHLGWCSVCQSVAAEYEDFRRPPPAAADEDAAWEAVRRKLPARQRPAPRWLAYAAAVAMVAGPALTWKWMSLRPPEVRVEEKIVREPVRAANVEVIDLIPEGERVRAGGPAEPGAPLPADTRFATFLLNGAAEAECAARVLDAQGRDVWSARLRSKDGVYTMLLGEEILRSRPLRIECGRRVYLVK